MALGERDVKWGGAGVGAGRGGGKLIFFLFLKIYKKAVSIGE